MMSSLASLPCKGALHTLQHFQERGFLTQISTRSFMPLSATVVRVVGLALWGINKVLLSMTFLVGLPVASVIGVGRRLWLGCAAHTRLTDGYSMEPASSSFLSSLCFIGYIRLLVFP